MKRYTVFVRFESGAFYEILLHPEINTPAKARDQFLFYCDDFLDSPIYPSVESVQLEQGGEILCQKNADRSEGLRA